MTTIATFNQTQLDAVQSFAISKNYAAMYGYIAEQIFANPSLVPGGIDFSIYFWYRRASSINANNTTDPATVFIRSVAKRGLIYGTNGTNGRTPTEADIQDISNSIGAKVAKDIKDGRGLPDFVTQLSNDIGTSSVTGGISIGGWRGSFYYWNDLYEKKNSSGVLEQKTVGEWIMSTPGEYEKFIAVNSQAVADTFQQFPDTNSGALSSFLQTIKKSFENVLTNPLTTGFDAGVAYNQIIGRAVIELNIRGYSLLGDLIKQEFRDLEFGIYTGINQLEHAITGKEHTCLLSYPN